MGADLIHWLLKDTAMYKSQPPKNSSENPIIK